MMVKRRSLFGVITLLLVAPIALSSFVAILNDGGKSPGVAPGKLREMKKETGGLTSSLHHVTISFCYP